MSGQQLGHFNLFLNIFRELQRFGLDPREWTIEARDLSKRGKFGIRHKADPELQMVGLWVCKNDGRFRVEKLSLLTL